jgi:hypothetical protein
LKICSNASRSAWLLWVSRSWFQELVTMVASLPSTMRLSASRSSSPLQEAMPT